jgi:biotin operon repressor
MNKEYRLASWPELSPAQHRTAYRRMLSEMSQRYVSLAQLVESSGLKRPEVKHFLGSLEASGKLVARDANTSKPARWAALRIMSAWFRRVPTPAQQRR